jgi:hypothetical protein
MSKKLLKIDLKSEEEARSKKGTPASPQSKDRVKLNNNNAEKGANSILSYFMQRPGESK